MSRGVRTSMLLGAALCALSMIAGCTSTKKEDRPAVLVKLVNRISIKRVWRTHLSGEVPTLRLGLGVAASGQQVFVANHKGIVEAYALGSGRRLWQKNLKVPLSAGPGEGDGLVVFGTSKGEIIALSEVDGAPRWRTRINSEILAAPAVGADLVVVAGVDGKLHGLSTADGSESWVVDQQPPRLSLRGSSRPTLVGDLAFSGFDNGRVVAVVRANGSSAWDAAIGQPHGSTELQRLIDVDAAVVADGDDLFAVAYQGRVARLTRETGEIVWARDMSSYRGLAVDGTGVYISTADGEVVRLDRTNGTEQWRQKALARRQLTAPVIYGGRVVVADLAGVVHWLDASDGALLARVQSGKHAINSTPLVAGGLLLVFSDDGDLDAFSASATTAPAPPPAPPKPVKPVKHHWWNWQKTASPTTTAPATAAPTPGTPATATPTTGTSTPAAPNPAAAPASSTP